MPCRSDYLEPTDKEKASVEVCKHLAYVKSKLHMEVSPSLLQSGASPYGDLYKLDEHTAELCRLCRGLNKKQKDEIIYDGRNPKARRLADWWDEHQKFDLKRRDELWERQKKLRDELNQVNKELQEFDRD